MNDLKVKDWFVFGEWFDIFWFHSDYIDGLSFTIKEKLRYGLSQMVTEQDGNIQHIYFSLSEWKNIGKKWLNEVVIEPKKLESVLNDIRKASDELNGLSDKLQKLDFEQISNNEQISWLNEYAEKHFNIWTLGMVPNVLELENSFLTDYLKAWLREKAIQESELIKIFQILSTPRELSAAQKEERDMLKLAQRKFNQKALTDHWKKYNWIYFGWIGPSLSLEYFKEVYSGLKKEGNASKKLADILERDKQLLADKKYWLKKLETPDNIDTLFRLLEDLLYMKTYRMDAIFRSYEAVQPLLKKIARDNYLSLQQIYNLRIDKLLEMMKKGKFDTGEVNRMGKYSALYFDGEKLYFLFSEEAKKIVDQIKQTLPKQAEINELKGECAYPGKVTGRVVMINKAEEMGKFQDGDVLASAVTDPSLLPIMKKAVAFVTNQGGLTCHAAIVARELHTPCVVGTKIATRVLKDGNLVEVDANKGIVKIIK